MPWGRGPGWRNVGELIRLFTAMGCEVRTIPEPVTTPDGPRTIRFVYNPANEGFIPITDLEDGEFLPPSEVAHWERRLGLNIPRGNAN